MRRATRRTVDDEGAVPMITVIMQPTYLPWMGYFDLIDQSDCFIFLDTVQFAKRSWQQRNRIKTSQGVHWLTVSVEQSREQRILDVPVADPPALQRKHWNSILSSYGRCPHFDFVATAIETIFTSGIDNLADLNIALIRTLTDLLKISARFLRSSEMAPSDRHREQLLVELCAQVGTDVYLSPPGSSDYLQSDREFSERGMRVAFQQFEHPVYPQRFGAFVPYLSVIDLLMNVGPTSLDVIREGRRPWKSIDEMSSVSPGSDFDAPSGET